GPPCSPPSPYTTLFRSESVNISISDGKFSLLGTVNEMSERSSSSGVCGRGRGGGPVKPRSCGTARAGRGGGGSRSPNARRRTARSEEHTSELQSRENLV